MNYLTQQNIRFKTNFFQINMMDTHNYDENLTHTVGDREKE